MQKVIAIKMCSHIVEVILTFSIFSFVCIHCNAIYKGQSCRVVAWWRPENTSNILKPPLSDTPTQTTEKNHRVTSNPGQEKPAGSFSLNLV